MRHRNHINHHGRGAIGTLTKMVASPCSNPVGRAISTFSGTASGERHEVIDGQVTRGVGWPPVAGAPVVVLTTPGAEHAGAESLPGPRADRAGSQAYARTRPNRVRLPKTPVRPSDRVGPRRHSGHCPAPPRAPRVSWAILRVPADDDTQPPLYQPPRLPSAERLMARQSSVSATPSGSGSRPARLHTSCAVVSAPTFDRAFARWCFTVECDRPRRWAQGSGREPVCADGSGAPRGARPRRRSRLERSPARRQVRPRTRSGRPDDGPSPATSSPGARAKGTMPRREPPPGSRSRLRRVRPERCPTGGASSASASTTTPRSCRPNCAPPSMAGCDAGSSAPGHRSSCCRTRSPSTSRAGCASRGS